MSRIAGYIEVCKGGESGLRDMSLPFNALSSLTRISLAI